MDLHIIKATANQVRDWVETLQHTYLAWDQSMTGLCAIASYKLKKELDLVGVKRVQIAVHDDGGYGEHCFVIVDNDLVVDVTATQFGRAPIEIRTRSNAENDMDWWHPSHVFETVDMFNEYCRPWPDYQRPSFCIPEAVDRTI